MQPAGFIRMSAAANKQRIGFGIEYQRKRVV